MASRNEINNNKINSIDYVSTFRAGGVSPISKKKIHLISDDRILIMSVRYHCKIDIARKM